MSARWSSCQRTAGLGELEGTEGGSSKSLHQTERDVKSLYNGEQMMKARRDKPYLPKDTTRRIGC